MTLWTKIKNELLYICADVLSLVPGAFLGSRCRRLFYKLALKKCGKKFYTHTRCFFLTPGKISVGNYVGFNTGCWVNGGGGITIGNHVLFGPGVIIHSSNHNFDQLDVRIDQQGHTHAPVVIEDNVWVAAGCIILPGVTIHSGAVIAAGAVVTRDVPANAVVGGVPARVLRMRGE
ncbi:MAG: acyltransferase [Verrucomicrobiota bacterium]|jgi:acetyltransferase-like isoleucine patch superfamily enzyme|nr:acyltransferase [Verrucomicrobiota bacterium]